MAAMTGPGQARLKPGLPWASSDGLPGATAESWISRAAGTQTDAPIWSTCVTSGGSGWYFFF